MIIGEGHLINLMIEEGICECADSWLDQSVRGRVLSSENKEWWWKWLMWQCFSKFPAQLSCCVSTGFTDFRSTFDNFPTLVSVLSQIFQAIRGDTERFHGDFQRVFEALFLASLGALSQRQFAVEQFLPEAVIFHADNMTGPTKLWLHRDGMDAGKRSLS